MGSPKPRERLALRQLVLLGLWVAGWSLLVATACPPAGITYVYDENGRLVAAEDPGQGTRVYVYDGAGNVTAINQFPPTKVLVLSFSPACAPTGATLTINGTGFDGTATIIFTGATGPAPVNSATYSQLVTTVPATATTGPVTVTVGSDSNSRSFTVGCGAPIITDFTTMPGQGCAPPPNCTSSPCPQHVGTGTPATPVTITGLNFYPTTGTDAVNDTVSFNNQRADATSATETTIVTNIPPTGSSGKIRVGTPRGTTTSAADLFVPPSGKTPADVDLCNTGRMANPVAAGTSATITIGTGGKLTELLFDGVAERRSCIGITNASCAPAGACNVLFDLLTPTGTHLFPSTPTSGLVNTGPWFFDTRPGGTRDPDLTLPATGSYAVVLLPYQTSTGSANVTVYDVPPDAVQFITPTPSPGTAVTLTTTSPCQNGRAYFAGTGGQRISVKFTSASSDQATAMLNGPVIGPPDIFPGGCVTNGCFLDAMTLSRDGEYYLLLNPSTTVTGTFGFTVYDVQDVGQPSLPVTATNPANVALNTPGQNAKLPITGTSTGQQITVHVTANSFTGSNCWVTVALLDPNGTPLTSVSPYTMPSSCTPTFDLAPKVVGNPPTTYSVSIDPAGPNTGSLSVRVSSP